MEHDRTRNEVKIEKDETNPKVVCMNDENDKEWDIEQMCPVENLKTNEGDAVTDRILALT